MGGDAPDVEITGLHYRSSDVRPGGLFFCVPGFKADGHDFAPDAVERGAVALVGERALELGVPEVVVRDVRAAMGPAAARYYGDPTATLRVVGITGTNGKTTTAFLTRAILERGGIQTGLLGTVKSIVGGVEEPVERTTPEGIDLQETFRRMLDAGDEACVMEVSSHALELGRAEGIRFACRVFTNLTQDHLDFHPDMEAYFTAKRRLFEGPAPVVVNLDDEYGRRLADETPDADHLRGRRRRRLPRHRTCASIHPAPPSRARRPTGRSRSRRACRACSTCRTRSRQLPRRGRSAWTSRPCATHWQRPSACPAGSSRWTRASRSRCSWTTRTRRRRSTTCCAPRAS